MAASNIVERDGITSGVLHNEPKATPPGYEHPRLPGISSASWTSEDPLCFMLLEVHVVDECEHHVESYNYGSYLTSAGAT